MNLTQYCAALRGKRIAVVGVGISNLPLIRLLTAFGLDVTARDGKTNEQLGNVAIELNEICAKTIFGEDYLQNLDEDVIFRSPGMMPHRAEFSAALERGAVLTSEMEAFFAVCPCPIIAVTGSDGKTTTATIIAEILRAAGEHVHLGGNIGTPLLDRADDMLPGDIVVLELSSFQLISMRKSPDVAVVTNVSPNHLDIHRDYDEYIDAKRNIFRHQTEDGLLVTNLDDEIARSFAAQAPGATLFFGRNAKPVRCIYLDGDEIKFIEGASETTMLRTADIKIPGEHNIDNYMAAIAATSGLVKPDKIQNVARTFGGVEHRLELVRELRGVKFYNDSIASSPSRTIAGLKSFDRKVILMAGGKDKGISYDAIGPEIIAHVKTLVLTGATAEPIRRAVEACAEYSDELTIIYETEFENAVRAAADAATDGDIVIMSPASTSFDRFVNFEERGKYFKEIVNGLE